MSVVLMYHALYPDNDLSAIDIEDQPYAVSESTFREQLSMLKDYQVGLLSNEASQPQPDVVITFDDGHISNLDIALPILKEFGMNAYFFVTTDFVESREFFCRPQQLKEFVDAGMVVGSHGVSHRFLSDLSDDESKRELSLSKERLQSWLGGEVLSISYPGGRYTSSTMDLAREVGYRQIFDSTISTVSATDLSENKPLARVAIRRSTSASEFHSMISNDKSYFRKGQRNQQVKQAAKRILGNKFYHGLYKSLTAR